MQNLYRFAKVLEPLDARRKMLEKAKRVHQFTLDVMNEKIWIQEKMPSATSTDYGKSLLSVQMLQKKNRTLHSEIDGHQPHFQNVIDTGRELVEQGHPQSDDFQMSIDELITMWDDLIQAVEIRRQRLELSEVAQQVSFM